MTGEWSSTTLEGPELCTEKPHDFRDFDELTSGRVLLYCRCCGEVRVAKPTEPEVSK